MAAEAAHVAALFEALYKADDGTISSQELIRALVVKFGGGEIDRAIEIRRAVDNLWPLFAGPGGGTMSRATFLASGGLGELLAAQWAHSASETVAR